MDGTDFLTESEIENVFTNSRNATQEDYDIFVKEN